MGWSMANTSSWDAGQPLTNAASSKLFVGRRGCPVVENRERECVRLRERDTWLAASDTGCAAAPVRALSVACLRNLPGRSWQEARTGAGKKGIVDKSGFCGC